MNVVNVVKQSLSSGGKCFGKTSILMFADRVFSRLSFLGIQQALSLKGVLEINLNVFG